MAPPLRKPDTAESGTSEGALQSSEANPDRARPSVTKSKQVSDSYVDPRSSKTDVLEGTKNFNSKSVPPSSFAHGPSQQGRGDRRERTAEPTPQSRTGARKYNTAPVPASPLPHGPSQQVKAQNLEPTPEPTPKQKAQSQSLLPEILVGFLQPESGDYKACEKYCISNPAVWIQDVKELRELAIRCLREGKDVYARRCAERLLMMTIVQQQRWKAAQAETYLKTLSESDIAFQDLLDTKLTKLRLESTGTQADTSWTGNAPRQSSSLGNDPTPSVVQTPTVKHNTGFTPGRQRDYLPAQTTQKLTRRDSHSAEIPHRPIRQPSQSHTGYTSGFQVAAPADAEEGSEINTGAEDGSEINAGTGTVDDNITLDEQQKRKIGINSKTRGMGPDLNSMNDYGEMDKLDASYRLYTKSEAAAFFVKGRVFAMVWHENVGIPANPNSTELSAPLDKPFHRVTRNADGVEIFSHIRRFVIVKAKVNRRYCLAIPINSYRGRGLTDKRMRMEEKQAHTIIHGSNSKPRRMTSEVRLDKQPIAVDLEPGEELTESSRLHFGKMQSIEWNVKVKNVGRITDPTHVRRLTLYFTQEFYKGDDTATEGESSRQ